MLFEFLEKNSIFGHTLFENWPYWNKSVHLNALSRVLTEKYLNFRFLLVANQFYWICIEFSPWCQLCHDLPNTGRCSEILLSCEDTITGISEPPYWLEPPSWPSQWVWPEPRFLAHSGWTKSWFLTIRLIGRTLILCLYAINLRSRVFLRNKIC